MRISRAETGAAADCKAIVLSVTGRPATYSTAGRKVEAEWARDRPQHRERCDETAAAVVERWNAEARKIPSDVILSQVADHAAFGGVVPETRPMPRPSMASISPRHSAKLACRAGRVDAIAATAGPGLIGGLVVGLTTAKALALATGKPLLAVNHLEGHALTARLTDGLCLPYLPLVSGGHTQFLSVEGVGCQIRFLGTNHRRRARRSLRQSRAKAPWPALSAVDRRSRRRRSVATLAPDLPRPMAGVGRAPTFSPRALRRRCASRSRALPPVRPGRRGPLRTFQAAVADVVADRAEDAIATCSRSTTGRWRWWWPAAWPPQPRPERSPPRDGDPARLRLVAPPARLCGGQRCA